MSRIYGSSLHLDQLRLCRVLKGNQIAQAQEVLRVTPTLMPLQALLAALATTTFMPLIPLQEAASAAAAAMVRIQLILVVQVPPPMWRTQYTTLLFLVKNASSFAAEVVRGRWIMTIMTSPIPRICRAALPEVLSVGGGLRPLEARTRLPGMMT